MKYTTEQQVIAARPQDTAGNSVFVQKTMEALHTRAGRQSFSSALQNSRTSKSKQLYRWFKRLPATAAVIIVIAIASLLGGAVYAAARYVPALIRVTSESKTARGTSEYIIPGFAACQTQGAEQTQRFEVNKDAPALSTDDVQKLVVARCEENLIDSFARKAWPTYGTNKVWKNGDAIYYARPDAIGTVQDVSKTSLTITTNSTTGQHKSYAAQSGQQITAYVDGQSVPISDLKSGDTVYVIARVTETYSTGSQDGSQANPRVVGAIGLVKLSEPLRYYGSMQNYLTEIPPCMGNPGEFCPNTAYIDIFPRAGGEAARNPDLATPATSTIYREISGIVTKFGMNTLALKSSSGATYTVTAPSAAFSDYNTTYAPSYGSGANLHVGSTVSLLYEQSKGANAKVITANQIESISLLLDNPSSKQNSPQQY